MPWRGYLDGWDPHSGIHGWALATDAPSKRLKLELLVGDVCGNSLLSILRNAVQCLGETRFHVCWQFGQADRGQSRTRL